MTKNKYIKKIVIVALLVGLLFAILVNVAVVLTDNVYLLFLLPLLWIVAAVYIIYSIFIPYRKKILAEDNIDYSELIAYDVNINQLKNISVTTPLANLIIPSNKYYFDDTYFYEEKKGVFTQMNLKDIVEIRKTQVKINKRSVCLVRYKNGDIEKDFRFRPNYTLWNKNFVEFLEQVEKMNPNAKIQKFSM